MAGNLKRAVAQAEDAAAKSETEKVKVASVHLPVKLWQELKVNAVQSGVTVSALVTELLTRYLASSPAEQAELTKAAAKHVRTKR